MQWRGYTHSIRVILGLSGDNGKENENYYVILGLVFGLFRDNGKENENYCLGFRGPP